MKITVCDSIMGSGKTCAAIRRMNEDKGGRYIYITPFLSEVERIKRECKEKEFVSPENFGKGKLSNLHELLSMGVNVASTHALFGTYSEQTRDLVKAGGYKLILDETYSIMNMRKCHKDDIVLLKKLNLMEVDENGNAQWIDNNYTGWVYSDLKAYAQTDNLAVYKDKMVFWSLPASMFTAFEDVLILTYMFEAQVQKYYYDLHGIDIDYIGTRRRPDGGYEFTDRPELPDYARTLKDKIHILDHDKLNAVGQKETAFSATWYKSNRYTPKGKEMLAQMKKNLVNLYTNIYTDADVKERMWTTFKEARAKLTGKGYTKAFVPCNARATNEYRNRKYLAYCVNIYFNPFLKNYFLDNGIAVKEDEYALSELVQWIWRSAIRDGEDIYIYLPSGRMRRLLTNWLDRLAA